MHSLSKFPLLLTSLPFSPCVYTVSCLVHLIFLALQITKPTGASMMSTEGVSKLLRGVGNAIAKITAKMSESDEVSTCGLHSAVI